MEPLTKNQIRNLIYIHNDKRNYLSEWYEMRHNNWQKQGLKSKFQKQVEEYMEQHKDEYEEPEEEEEISLCNKCDTCANKKKFLSSKSWKSKAVTICKSCEVTKWCLFIDEEIPRDPITIVPKICELGDCPVSKLVKYIRYLIAGQAYRISI